MRRLGDSGPVPRPGGDDKRMPSKLPQEAKNAMAKMAMEFLTGELITQARKSIVEERRLGEPGDEFATFRKMVERTLGKDTSTTGMILMSRLAFLLAGAQELLKQHGTTEIVLENIEFDLNQDDDKS